MFRLIGAGLTSIVGALLAGSAVPADSRSGDSLTIAPIAPRIEPLATIPAPPPEPPPPPTPQQALANGVLIVVSLPAQRMVVFQDGKLWTVSPVSTGKRGHATPTGVFPILQKRVRHRSNLYGGAPMPYMQRLTWDGVALHAGHLPGRAASHGCVRLPWDVARRLFAITNFTSTVVLVTPERVHSAETALALVTGRAAPETLLAAERSRPATPADGPHGTIQLGAPDNPKAAQALWRDLAGRRSELAALDHAVIPAVVKGRQVFRLRASGPAAHALCSRLAGEGVPCLKVPG